MRVMILIKANKTTEAGVMPSEQLLAEMGRFNEQLVKAGIMRGGEGLHPTSKGARVHFSGADRTVARGPFPELGQLICGFWIWQVNSMDEAIEWVKRCPNPTGDQCEIEIRRIMEAEDFGPELTPELRQRETELRRKAEELSGAAGQVS